MKGRRKRCVCTRLVELMLKTNEAEKYLQGGKHGARVAQKEGWNANLGTLGGQYYCPGFKRRGDRLT